MTAVADAMTIVAVGGNWRRVEPNENVNVLQLIFHCDTNLGFKYFVHSNTSLDISFLRFARRGVVSTDWFETNSQISMV